MTDQHTPDPNKANQKPAGAGSWRWIALVGPIAAFAVILGPIVVSRGALPDPMNLSWDSDGVPKNSRSINSYIAIQSGFALFASLGFVAGGLRRMNRTCLNAQAVLMATFATIIFSMLTLSTVLANRGESGWETVNEPSDLWAIPSVGLPLLLLGVAMMRYRDVLMPAPKISIPDPSAGLHLKGTQTAAWHGSATARWPRYGALVGLVAAGVAVIVGLWVNPVAAIALPLGIVGLVALAFSSIGVTVDKNGLTVTYGFLPWPRTHIGLDRIVSVGVADVVPIEHGGWGYRGSVRLMKRAAVIVRRGEGIHLGLEGDRTFVVTVDNAEQGAGVLNDLRARSLEVSM